MTILLEQLRARQWTKNLVVLAGVVFSMQLTDTSQLLRALVACGCFCLLSSAGYVFNDLRDLENDRLHPRKRTRPLPSGRLGRLPAVALMVAAMIAGLGGAFLLGVRPGFVALAYVLLSLLYTLRLKKVVLLDVIVIAIGFMLRATVGVEALDPRPELSPWLLVCTLFLALFIAVVKRRHERVTLSDRAQEHRATLSEYSPELLDQLVPVVTGSTILAYALYTISPQAAEHADPSKMVYTVPFVVYGIFRYLYLVYQKGRGGAPAEILLTDLPILADVLLWGLTIILILYLA